MKFKGASALANVINVSLTDFPRRFEKKEMLCKKGCRCEQQYGLQRLLAYDPNNECRGVFAEWFRFPSLCICE